jgi:integrase
MEAELKNTPDEDAHLAGDLIPVQIDGYCREQDLISLRVEDVVQDGDTIALRFGRSSRGESVKTGRDQGVLLDEPHSKAIIRRLIKGKQAKDKVFGISAAAYRKWWHFAAEKVGVSQPPHTCRHTGASRDLATGYRSQAQVMRRGRWLADKSTMRYARTHAWTLACSQQPAHVVALGAAILQLRPLRPAKAQE